MNENALKAGVDAARAIITAEVKPTKISEQAALDDLLLSLRGALKDIGERSPYQAIAKVLAKHSLAGCPLVTKVAKDRRSLISGRIALGFVHAHLRSAVSSSAQVSQ